jgi:hygromycin-B 4-O-kinase
MDDAQVQAFLEERFGGRAGRIAPAGRGEWSVAYAFRCDGEDYVVRFGLERADFEKDRLATAFSSSELPVPRVLEVGEALGTHYAISERVAGTFLETLDEAGMRAVLPSLLAALDAARLVDVAGSTGFGSFDAAGDAAYASWQEALLAVGYEEHGGRIGGWPERLDSSPVGGTPFEEALACLRELAPRLPNDRHLTHNDLLNRNVFVADGAISAVIDWGCAMWGDFLYELAQFTFWAPWFPAWRAVDFAGEAQRHYEGIGLDVPGFAERLRAYEIHIGLAGCAYNAFRERWDELEATTRRTLAACERQPEASPT